MQVNEVERKIYKCDVCSRSYKWIDNLQTHLKIHEDGNMYMKECWNKGTDKAQNYYLLRYKKYTNGWELLLMKFKFSTTGDQPINHYENENIAYLFYWLIDCLLIDQ